MIPTRQWLRKMLKPAAAVYWIWKIKVQKTSEATLMFFWFLITAASLHGRFCWRRKRRNNKPNPSASGTASYYEAKVDGNWRNSKWNFSRPCNLLRHWEILPIYLGGNEFAETFDKIIWKKLKKPVFYIGGANFSEVILNLTKRNNKNHEAMNTTLVKRSQKGMKKKF